MLVAAAFLLLLSLSSETQAQRRGALRLVDTFDSHDWSVGRLEIFLNFVWGTVCFSSRSGRLDLYEADLACRELGFLYAEAVGNVLSFRVSPGTGRINLSGVECSPSDFRLVNCDRSFDTCNHIDDVAVNCTNIPNDVRLLGSDRSRTSNLSAGRLQILINREWGTVCSDGFSTEDANVACRQLGFNDADSFATASELGLTFPSDVFVLLSDLRCPTFVSGSNLRACPHAGVRQNTCDHDNDIILSCVAEGHLRLVETSESPRPSLFSSRTLQSAGRLEIFLRGEWGTVCDDDFGRREADVACRQMGFTSAEEYGNIDALGFPALSSSRVVRVWLGSVECSSDAETLLSCSHSGVGASDCPHSQDVGLQCGTEFSPSTPEDDADASSVALASASAAGLLFLLICLPVCLLCTHRCCCRRKKTRGTPSASPSHSSEDNESSTQVVLPGDTSQEQQAPSSPHPSSPHPQHPPRRQAPPNPVLSPHRHSVCPQSQAPPSSHPPHQHSTLPRSSRQAPPPPTASHYPHSTIPWQPNKLHPPLISPAHYPQDSEPPSYSAVIAANFIEMDPLRPLTLSQQFQDQSQMLGIPEGPQEPYNPSYPPPIEANSGYYPEDPIPSAPPL